MEMDSFRKAESFTFGAEITLLCFHEYKPFIFAPVRNGRNLTIHVHMNPGPLRSSSDIQLEGSVIIFIWHICSLDSALCDTKLSVIVSTVLGVCIQEKFRNTSWIHLFNVTVSAHDFSV